MARQLLPVGTVSFDRTLLRQVERNDKAGIGGGLQKMSVQQPWIVIHRYTMKRRVEILSLALLALSGPPLWAGDVRPARIEEVEIRDRAFYVNRRPFFPLMAWLQDARNFPLLKDCAMNTTAGYSGGSSGTKSVAEYLALVEQAGLYGVMPFDPRLKGGPALLGYIHDDEPDLLHQESDAVGYDIYPIYGWNKPEWLCLGHDATERLVQIAGTRPVYAWIETSKGGQWTGDLDGQKDVKPEHIRAEVWMSICRGATAIGYSDVFAPLAVHIYRLALAPARTR